MGNQLSSIAPSQILSVNHYFTDLTDYEYDVSLGSTRFFKVARAKSKEGLCVVKVFAIQDPSLPLRTYHDQIKETSDKLQYASSVLPYQKIIITEKAGVLVRQYIKDNLYDRISTRPFLNLVEKKWIVFQLLCALGQCHQNQVYHGDIKTENVMVTSWTSVLLTDLASFKPTFLQQDNPADFSYFFDTSRRRTCYLAPERFQDHTRQSDVTSSAPAPSVATAATASTDQQSVVSSEASAVPLDLGLMRENVSELTSAMDIFSAGCVIAELFSEGSSLFDLSQLLAYRTGDYDITPVLEKIEDIKIREMILNMIAKDPEQRKEAAEYLEEYRGVLFPDQFYTFFQKYMIRFISLPVMTADERIARVADDICHILTELCPAEEKSESSSSKNDDAGLVIIISLVTSCVRNCKYCDSKLKCLDLLLKMGQHTSDEIILERIVPYILYLIGDSVPRVRARALWTLTQSLQLVKTLPKNEGYIFPEYILPALADFPDDSEVIVRIAYAENIAQIAETALRFLEMAQLQYNNMDVEDVELDQSLRYQGSYDVELQELHEVIQQKVVNLLSDSQNIVKQTLLEKGITRLCVFFGRQKANDVVLSHMITFLNDKQDWQLRGAFFDSIVGVASYVGWQSLAMLKPLLQQGLSDTEEFVVCKALNALTCLTELGLLQKSTLNDFTADNVAFLCHPNVWVRYAAVGFVSAVARSLTVVDIHCKLLPLLSPFIKEKIVQADQEVLLISVLKEPVSRSVYDFVVRSQMIEQFFHSLQHRQSIRKLNKQGQKAEYRKFENEGLSHMFRKLMLQGMTEEQEEMLLRLKLMMLKLNHAKTIALEKVEEREEPVGLGKIDLRNLGTTIVRRHAELVTRPNTKSDASTLASKSTKKTKREYHSPLNAEWNQMFGNIDGVNSTTKSQTQQLGDINLPVYKHPLARSVSLPQSPKVKPHPIPTLESVQPVTVPQRIPPADMRRKLSESSQTTEPRSASYRYSLRDLVKHKREQFAEEEKTRELIEAAIDSNKKGQLRRPKGTLLIHLQEHRSAVNKLDVCPNTSLFASASNDGTVKLWDAQRLEKQGMIVKSCFTFPLQQGETATRVRAKGLVFLQGEQTLACATQKGDVYIISLESLPSTSCPQYKPAVKLNTSFDTNNEGDLVDMHQFDTASHSVLTYATVRGLIYGWDRRSPRTIWKLQHDPALGLITSFVVDPSQCWLTVGSSNGELVCWDMRFQLPVTQLTHPRGARVRRLSASPLFQSNPSWVTCAVQGNNEVSVWNLETGACEKSLWASHAPPLSQTQVSPHAVYGIYTSPPDAGQFILTAGSDRRIRLWDLQVPENSYIVAGSSSDNLNDVILNYKLRLVDGTEVFREVYCKSSQAVVQEDVPKRGPDKPPTGHHDCITDLAVVTSPQHFLISAARDGAIKIWK